MPWHPASERRPGGPVGRVLLAALTMAVVSGCGTDAGSETLSCGAARGYDATGTASWYGDGQHGLVTASGQTFDVNGLTAAHRELPFGTRIRVTNRRNGRSVVLTVNDRGPFVDGRIVDVSRRAAQRLGFIEAGLAPVRVETVSAC